MKTPRDYTFKYEGKNPFAKLHPDEPWFFLRAQDKLCVKAIEGYRDAIKAASDEAYRSGDTAHGNVLLKQALGLLKVIERFEEWQGAHSELVKLPD